MLAWLAPEAPTHPEPCQLLADLRHALLEAAAAGPLVLVLEDLHWADRSTQDLVADLTEVGTSIRRTYALTDPTESHQVHVQGTCCRR
jgi:predicted ATPase